MTRTEILASLTRNPRVDVLIVGAGINGIGTFRDLALNGVRVLSRCLLHSGQLAAGRYTLFIAGGHRGKS